MSTFHERKRKRAEHYENQVKGWRLAVCAACGGNGKYDTGIRGRTPDCASCSGTGRERVKPECETDIEPLIGQVIAMQPSDSVALHVFIQNRRNAVYQFVGLDDGTKDPRMRTRLKFGYDDIEGVTDWYIEDRLGGKHYLHQFDCVTMPK